MQRFNAPQIAKIIGKTPKTVHNHRRAGRISMDRDEDGEYFAHIHEVERAYKEKFPDIGRRLIAFVEGDVESANENVAPTLSARGEGRASPKSGGESSDTSELLKEMLKAQERRHEAELERLQESHENAFANVKQLTNLLEDQSKKTDQLTKTIEAMVEREQRREEERRIQMERRREALEKQKAAEAEAKARPFWKKLLG